MALDLRDVALFGPALPEPFVKLQLEALLAKECLLPKATGAEGKELRASWDALRRKLRDLGDAGGAIRVANHVLEPLAPRLGYDAIERQDEVETREGLEDGGLLLRATDGSVLRAWPVAVGTDLDAPSRRGRAYRFSPSRIAGRVLLAKGERAGLVTDGQELRLVLSDPARPESHVAIGLDRAGGWRGARDVPDSYRLLLALASPAGVAKLAEITEAARLAQTSVTKKLREQARRAVEGFLQEVLDHPANRAALEAHADRDALARTLWNESLILVYRLLFVLKLEASPDPARAFSFASTALWRQSYSPATALAPVVREAIDRGAETGGFLEASLRALFRLFTDGMASSELRVHALGGALFGAHTTPVLGPLAWGEAAVANLLDALLWTGGDGAKERERVHYGALDVEDLGRVYEALLELEPGIAAEPMARLRRAKLEVVVPAAQGEPYRVLEAAAEEADEDEDDASEEEEDEAPKRGKKRGKGAATKVRFVESIAKGRFFLRVGLGRKSSGSYYTPHAFVRFLVQETLGPQVAERSPQDDPQPAAILGISVLDPAMGSGHFLVEACRFLGAALYEACRLCDERALEAEAAAENAKTPAERDAHLDRARALRARVEALPDPEDEMLAFLPSRAAEGSESGLSQKKAEAIARRLVAVHCLYGVDKNPLAVELAKLSLWLESYAEGLPLTFLDHRLVRGDSLTGPFFEQVLTLPRSARPIGESLLVQGVEQKLGAALAEALAHVRALDATVGKDVADLAQKRLAKERLDAALAPFRTLASAWSGSVMLGDAADDGAYEKLLAAVAEGADAGAVLRANETLRRAVSLGADGVPYDLAFPEVFHPGGVLARSGGFDAVVGNPPWDAIKFASKEFLAGHDLRVLEAPTKREREEVEERLLADPGVSRRFDEYQEEFERKKRTNDRLYEFQKVFIDGDLAGRQLDEFRIFMERNAQLIGLGGATGAVVPSAFHANAGATGIRRLYLEHLALRCCFSFENRKLLFEIHRSFKLALVVARNEGRPTEEFECAFYLHDLEWLFESREPLRYTLDFVKRTGGEFLSMLELRSIADAEIAKACFDRGRAFGQVCEDAGIRMGREHDMAQDSHRFTPVAEILPAADPRDPAVAADLAARGWLTLHEGKTFHQYDDRWGDRPRYLVHVDQLADKPAWREASRYYRLAFRDIASSTNERTGIFCLAAPPVVFGNTAPCEREPEKRRARDALLLLALADAFVFDWTLRVKNAAHVNLFILNGCPLPQLSGGAGTFLAHAALRLTCNHTGYAALWREQLGAAWREPTAPMTWPVLDGPEARGAVRAAIDAVVAHAYGLDRNQFEHVLTSFSHKSDPAAPHRCLAAFDELRTIGLAAFCEKHDPYHDVPLVTSLPEPVIDLPAPATPHASQLSLIGDGPLAPTKGRKRRKG